MSVFFLNLRPKIKVSDPMRPINIVALINSFPINERCCVPLSENPRLLNPETVSKNISKKH